MMLGADKQPGTTIGRRAAGIDTTQTLNDCHGSMIARYVNLQGLFGQLLAEDNLLADDLADDDYAALREAVLPAQAQEPRATNDIAKGATRSGCRGVII